MYICVPIQCIVSNSANSKSSITYAFAIYVRKYNFLNSLKVPYNHKYMHTKSLSWVRLDIPIDLCVLWLCLCAHLNGKQFTFLKSNNILGNRLYFERSRNILSNHRIDGDDDNEHWETKTSTRWALNVKSYRIYYKIAKKKRPHENCLIRSVFLILLLVFLSDYFHKLYFDLWQWDVVYFSKETHSHWHQDSRDDLFSIRL